MNGSPVCLGGHVQIGLCLMTVHLASTPHEPSQGLIHFWLLHALFAGQSELKTHWGRHDGGLPSYPEIHVHTAKPLSSRQWLFDPQGEGVHGLLIIGAKMS